MKRSRKGGGLNERSGKCEGKCFDKEVARKKKGVDVDLPEWKARSVEGVSKRTLPGWGGGGGMGIFVGSLKKRGPSGLRIQTRHTNCFISRRTTARLSIT